MGNFFKSNESDDEEFCHIELPKGNQESVAMKLSKQSEKYRILIEEWTKTQKELSLLRDKDLSENISVDDIRYVGGVDISFPSDKNDLIHACACLVVLDFKTLDIVYKKCEMVHLTSMYIPEYLAFREVDPYIDLFNKLKTENPDIYPDVVLVDGNGILHPRKFGIASHLGVLLDLPTIGVAKKLFHVDGLEKNHEFKEAVKNLSDTGSSVELIGESGFLYGKAVRSTSASTNPVFVSVGNKIPLNIAVDIVLLCCKKRVPEPVRWADIFSREFLRNSYTKHSHLCTDYNYLNEEFLNLSKCLESR